MENRSLIKEIKIFFNDVLKVKFDKVFSVEETQIGRKKHIVINEVHDIGTFPMDQVIVIKIVGKVEGNIDTLGKVVVVGDVEGRIDAGNDVEINGNVKKAVDAGNNIVVKGQVYGNIDSGNNVVVTGDVKGKIDAGGNVVITR